jgi:hypothetical protein
MDERQIERLKTKNASFKKGTKPDETSIRKMNFSIFENSNKRSSARMF